MEHNITVTITRYKPTNLLEQPEEYTVFKMERAIEDGDTLALYDILDQAKLEGAELLTDDVAMNCEHDSIVEDDTETCMVCGRSAWDIKQDDAEARIDNQIDEAKL